MKKKILKTLKVVSISIAALFAAVLFINLIYSAYESFHYKPAGELVETQNGRIHVYKQLHENSDSTIVFLDAFGGGSSYYDFKMLWEPLSEQYSIATLDYLGYGMSESTNAERTLENISSEIKEALQNAALPEPYIFVSHSLGGIYATDYAVKYPDTIKSIIFIDNSAPNILAADDTELQMLLKQRPLFLFMKLTGAIRFMSENSTPGLTAEERRASTYFTNKNMFNKVMMSEIKYTTENCTSMIDVKIPDDIPELMMVSKSNDDMSLEFNWPKSWLQSHEDIFNSNSDSELLLLDAGHYLHWEKTDEVLQHIIDFLEK